MNGCDSVPAPAEEVPAQEERPIFFGGELYRLRPLHPEDAERLAAFFRSHSEETVLSRYGYMIAAIKPERVRAFVGVDQQRDVALGIFEGSGPGQVLHAVGRYYTEGRTATAEIAFVVRESKRRLGMATALLQELAAIARGHGLTKFYAQVLRTNEAIRRLFDRFDPAVAPVLGSDWLVYLVALEKIPARKAPLSPKSAEPPAPRRPILSPWRRPSPRS